MKLGALAIAMAVIWVCATVTFAQSQGGGERRPFGVPRIPPPTVVYPTLTVLQKFDIPGTTYETVVGIVKLPTRAFLGLHSLSGLMSGYVLRGEFSFVASKNGGWFKPGEAFHAPYRDRYDGRAGEGGADLLMIYVVEKETKFFDPPPHELPVHLPPMAD